MQHSEVRTATSMFIFENKCIDMFIWDTLNIRLESSGFISVDRKHSVRFFLFLNEIDFVDFPISYNSNK